jgi:hypothetical protein
VLRPMRTPFRHPVGTATLTQGNHAHPERTKHPRHDHIASYDLERVPRGRSRKRRPLPRTTAGICANRRICDRRDRSDDRPVPHLRPCHVFDNGGRARGRRVRIHWRVDAAAGLDLRASARPARPGHRARRARDLGGGRCLLPACGRPAADPRRMAKRRLHRAARAADRRLRPGADLSISGGRRPRRHEQQPPGACSRRDHEARRQRALRHGRQCLGVAGRPARRRGPHGGRILVVRPRQARADGVQWKAAGFHAVYIGFRCAYASPGQAAARLRQSRLPT